MKLELKRNSGKYPMNKEKDLVFLDKNNNLVFIDKKSALEIAYTLFDWAGLSYEEVEKAEDLLEKKIELM